MAHIELPRALEDYFAFAETAATRNGRRFVLSMPYFHGSGAGAKLDRLQWWFHVSPEQERQMGDAAVATFRAQATERFRRHIERWLQNTRQRLHGDEPIPRIASLDRAVSAIASTPDATAAPAPATSSATVSASTLATEAPEPAVVEVLPWPADRVANG
jgi:hypothetical protein